ncbi:Peroxisomal hydratase-dehydrogenase-epimerase [Friedmanniomyces simplex]|uniref:Peroxisomal hydratase-dehydrogenase-epimerase n=1 Tax=Friedmanniomyces simplex TaxID=329884 RepID=A0A4U0XHL0_9PEZI|nr:Peroxisomal hydratase-dehydrogenase-epimerase [Friedmanniomyces simplex]
MANELRFDDQVVVITGAGAGLGREYAKLLASRGAKVVVNDLGGSRHGDGGGASKAADEVVKEIVAAGGQAVADYNSVEQGDKIIETAIRHWKRVDVLINNAGILRDITIKNMTDKDWDVIMAVHLTGAYKTTRAAWPYFRKQRYGRVINTSSSSGLFGNFGQSNYAGKSTAKLALVGFTETLAKEGGKYNITANVLAPGAASRLTETIWPPDMMNVMAPAWVAPLVATLVHASCKESGSIFEAAAGHYSKVRWVRSKGLVLRADDSLTPGALLKGWAKVRDFRDAEHPTRVADSMALLQEALQLPPNEPGESLDFAGKVALVTGGGEGLGRAYALLFAKLGAKVVVNDLKGAEKVAEQIRSNGGDAIAETTSVEKGAAVVKAAIDRWGRIDIIVNNAGILRDKAFANMTEDLWFPVVNVHLRGTYQVTKAAWPHMLKQKSRNSSSFETLADLFPIAPRYGRIVNITSTSGIYGNFGQANYAAAKTGIIGLTKTCAREGAKHNIHVNAVAPSAGTNMTRTVRPEDQVQAMKPDFVAPLVAVLCSDRCPDPTGGLYEAGTGWFAATRWQRARGVDFPHQEGVPLVEAVHEVFGKICDFDDGQADHPDTPEEGGRWYMANIERSVNKQLARRKERSKI